jgi:hypothetical protein
LESVLGSIRVSPGLSGSRKTDERLYDWTETINTTASLGMSAPFKLRFLNLSPQFSVSDRYERVSADVWEHTLIDKTRTPPDTVVVKGSQSVESDNQVSMNTGVSASTNLYGTFYPEIGALRGIRHTITPSASYSYTPSVQGRPSSERVGLTVRNSVDLKVASGGDGQGEGAEGGAEAGGAGAEGAQEEKEKTRKLSGVLLWSLSTSYDPNLPKGRNWSRISSLVNVRVLGTNVSVSQTIDPYQWDVLNTSLTSSVAFRGTHPFGRAAEITTRELNVVAADTLENDTDVGGRPSGNGKDTDQAKKDEGLPWDFSLAVSYSKAKGFDQASSTLNFGGGISITRGWKLSYRTTYNVIDREFLGDYYSLSRDLHCWEMSFSRQKLGDEWEFYFKINIKAHPEIYAEEGSRGLGGGTFGSPLGY